MEKKFSDMIQTSARGSMILIVGRMLTTFISAAGTILVARILGSESFGVINIALIPIFIAGFFVNNGTRSAIISYIAEYRNTGEQNKINEIVVCGITLHFTISITVTIIMLLISGFLANQVFSLPEIAPIIRILTLSILFQSIVSTSTALIVGYEKMNQFIIVQIIKSISKTIIGPLLIYIGLGVTGAALGHSLPFLIAGIFAALLVYLDHGNIKFSFNFLNTATIKKIVVYMYPLLLANVLGGGTNRILEFLLSVNITTEAMGNYSAAKSLSVLVFFFTSPIGTATFPLLSKLTPKDSLFKTVYQNIIKYETLVVFPIIFAIIALSKQIVSILYGPTYTQTSLYMQIHMVSFVLVALGSTVNYNLLSSQRVTQITFHSSLITLFLGIPMGLVLIPRYGVMGRIFIFLTAPTAGQLYTLIWIIRNYKIGPDYTVVVKLLISVIVGFVLCRIYLIYTSMSQLIDLFAGGFILVVSYFIMVLVTGVLKKENLIDIRNVAKSSEFLAPIVEPILNIVIGLARE